jgi:hypothetical protein
MSDYILCEHCDYGELAIYLLPQPDCYVCEDCLTQLYPDNEPRKYIGQEEEPNHDTTKDR